MISFQSSIKRIVVTGGAGFIGGTLIRKLLKETDIQIFNIDKLGFASDLTAIKKFLNDFPENIEKYHFVKLNLLDLEKTQQAIKTIDPDIIFHLAAESHVDRSISEPNKFIDNNVIGTLNLLESIRSHWDRLSLHRRNIFRLLHISTDEVFGSIENKELFSEKSSYNPRSPYSASKAASDHLVRSWHHTYGIPILITHCSNNFGPWQFPEKLIPKIILNGYFNKSIPIYGDGENIRDWIYVEDHVDALIRIIIKGSIGSSYCIGSEELRTNNMTLESICILLDKLNKRNSPHSKLKKFVKDRAGHDKMYGINNKKITDEIGWSPSYNFDQALELTVKWYLDNIEWCRKIEGTY